MKKAVHILIVVLAFTFALPLTYAQRISGNGNVIKQPRDISSFTSIVTSDGWDLVLAQGTDYALTVETDENLLPYVRTEVRGDVLHIFSETRISNSRRRKVHVTFKALESIKASDGADISVNSLMSAERLEMDLSDGSDLEGLRLAADAFSARFSDGSDARISFESIQEIEIEAREGSDLELRNIEGKSCRLSLMNGSDAELSGRTGLLVLTAKEGSDIEGRNFEAREARLNLSDSSDAELTVTGTLEVVLRNGSDLECRGKPTIEKYDLCKSCDLELN